MINTSLQAESYPTSGEKEMLCPGLGSREGFLQWDQRGEDVGGSWSQSLEDPGDAWTELF